MPPTRQRTPSLDTEFIPDVFRPQVESLKNKIVADNEMTTASLAFLKSHPNPTEADLTALEQRVGPELGQKTVRTVTFLHNIIINSAIYRMLSFDNETDEAISRDPDHRQLLDDSRNTRITEKAAKEYQLRVRASALQIYAGEVLVMQQAAEAEEEPPLIEQAQRRAPAHEIISALVRRKTGTG